MRERKVSNILVFQLFQQDGIIPEVENIQGVWGLQENIVLLITDILQLHQTGTIFV